MQVKYIQSFSCIFFKCSVFVPTIKTKHYLQYTQMSRNLAIQLTPTKQKSFFKVVPWACFSVYNGRKSDRTFMGLSERDISCSLTTNFKGRYKQVWHILETSPVADVKIELRHMVRKGWPWWGEKKASEEHEKNTSATALGWIDYPLRFCMAMQLHKEHFTCRGKNGFKAIPYHQIGSKHHIVC